MKLYNIIKIFTLAFMLGVYILFTLTLVAAYHSGGWIVIIIDKYHEGLAEVILLTSILPLTTYVTIKEILSSLNTLKTQRKHGEQKCGVDGVEHK